MDFMSRVPRWIKCIPWQKKFSNFLSMQKLYVISLYPVLIYSYYGYGDNPYADRLFWLKPTTDEERMKIKKNWSDIPFDRDWEMGEYEIDEPPQYDTWRRRQNYPEYYGDKYNTHQKYKMAY